MSGGGRGTRMSTSGRPKSVSPWKGRMGPRGVRFCCFFRTVPRDGLQLLFALWHAARIAMEVVQRAPLKARETLVNLESRLGKTQVQVDRLASDIFGYRG